VGMGIKILSFAGTEIRHVRAEEHIYVVKSEIIGNLFIFRSQIFCHEGPNGSSLFSFSSFCCCMRDCLRDLKL